MLNNVINLLNSSMIKKQSNSSERQSIPKKKTQLTACTDSIDQKQFLKSKFVPFNDITPKNKYHNLSQRTQTMKQIHSQKNPIINNSSMNYLDQNSLLISNIWKKSPKHTHPRQTLVDELLSYSMKLLGIFYNQEYFNKCQRVVISNRATLAQFNTSFQKSSISILKYFKQKSKQLSSNLNTVYYSIEGIKYLPLPQIQKQILLQWKTNILLSTLRNQWYIHIERYISECDKDMRVEVWEVMCEQFCQFMAHLSFYIFREYYRLQMENRGKSKESIQQKIAKQMMRYIITDSSYWRKKIFVLLEQPLRKHRNGSKPILEIDQPTKFKLLDIVMKEIKISELRTLLSEILSRDQTVFMTTAEAVEKFTTQHSILAKIQNITNIRLALQQDILIYQTQLLSRSYPQFDITHLDKDHMFSFLILGILSHGIKIQSLTLSLKEIKLLLGEEIDQVLNTFKCPSYFTDLEAILDFFQIQIGSFV